MKTLLYLVHRIPYPPNKGDKIRSYQLLKYLSERYRVSVGAFVDYAEDWSFRPDLEALCDDVCLVPLVRWSSRLRSATGLCTGKPLTLPYYHDRRMARWVRSKLARGVDAILVFASSMAQYVESAGIEPTIRIVDFVDLDSEKWRQYGIRRRGIAGAIYRREARLLADYETAVARRFSHSLVISDAEAEPLLARCPEIAARIHIVSNGVDYEFFDPNADLRDPYGSGGPVIVFTGAMDYWPNVDAVCWFGKQIWPRIRSSVPTARFFIVGSHPARAVTELGGSPGVHVTGTVEDVRPYLKFAALAIAPMRVARGIQNKVLEAMAMGLPVLATAAALEGLSGQVAANVTLAADEHSFVATALAVMHAGKAAEVAKRNRAAIVNDYDWSKNLRIVSDLVNGGATAPLPHASGRRRAEGAVG